MTALKTFKRRFGASRFPKPQLPVIPLPLADHSFNVVDNSRLQARKRLATSRCPSSFMAGASFPLTKADPWPTYRVLQNVSLSLGTPLWFVECGPDDTKEQGEHFQELQNYCPNVKFLRLGGESYVSEEIKQLALTSCDVVVSLVDNIQETFGLSIAEAMAAGRPVVASNWNGYRDLVRDGIDGFLIPSRWDEQAQNASFPLSWIQKTELSTFPHVSGSLAQLVQIDLRAAESAIATILSQPTLASAMGRAARKRAVEQFSPASVSVQFRDLFNNLAEIRKAASVSGFSTPPFEIRSCQVFFWLCKSYRSILASKLF